MNCLRSLLGALAVLGLCGPHQAGAFECPRPEKPAPGVLQESAQNEQATSQMFASGEIEDKIGVAVATLQRQYPQVTDTELANYLIGAYCPVVANMPGLSEAQKTAKVEHFAATLFEMLSEQKSQ